MRAFAEAFVADVLPTLITIGVAVSALLMFSIGHELRKIRREADRS